MPLWPDLAAKEAEPRASAAIHYASAYHQKWFWHRVGDPQYWRQASCTLADA
jgi:hypothetical protein